MSAANPNAAPGAGGFPRAWIVWLAAVGLAYVGGRLAAGYWPGAETTPKNPPTSARAAAARSGPAVSFSEVSTWESLLREEETVEREHRAAAMLATLDSASLRQVYETLRRLPWSTRRNQLLTQLLRRWGAVDSSAALAAVEALPPSERTESQDTILTGWATVDFPGAWGWLAGKIDVTSGQTVIQRRYLGLLESVLIREGPKQAMAIVGRMPENLMQRLSGVQIAEYLGRYAPESAAWVNSLPGNNRTNAVIGFARSLAENDPRASADWAMALGPGDARMAVQYSLREWGKSGDLTSAREWLAQQPFGELRMAALVGLVPSVAARDVGAALELYAQVSPGSQRQVRQFALPQLLSMPPLAALDWIVGTAEPAERMSYLERQVRTSLQLKSSDLRNVVETHPGLTVEERSALLSQIDRARTPSGP